MDEVLFIEKKDESNEIKIKKLIIKNSFLHQYYYFSVETQ